jgi:hypothetical protein
VHLQCLRPMVRISCSRNSMTKFNINGIHR